MRSEDTGTAVAGVSGGAFVWPAILVLSAAAAWTVSIVPALTSLRPVVVFWFLAVCPGMAFVRLGHFREGATTWTLAVALSLALDALVAVAGLYGGAWSPTAGLARLIAISLAGSALQVLNARPESDRPRPLAAPTAAGWWALPTRRLRALAHGGQRRVRIGGLLLALALLALVIALLAQGSMPLGTALSALAGMMPTLRTIASPQAALRSLLESAAGDGATTAGIVVAVLLCALLFERELERAAGRAVEAPWARRRNVAIVLLSLAYAVFVTARVAGPLQLL